jgi:hypothetical protein
MAFAVVAVASVAGSVGDTFPMFAVRIGSGFDQRCY